MEVVMCKYFLILRLPQTILKAVLEDVIEIALSFPDGEKDKKNRRKSSVKPTFSEPEPTPTNGSFESKGAFKKSKNPTSDCAESLASSVKSKFSRNDVSHNSKAGTASSEDRDSTNSSQNGPEEQPSQACVSSTLEAISRIFSLPEAEISGFCQDVFYRKLYSHCLKVRIGGATDLPLDDSCEIRCIVSITSNTSEAARGKFCTETPDELSLPSSEPATSPRETKRNSIASLKNQLMRQTSKFVTHSGDPAAKSERIVKGEVLARCGTASVSRSSLEGLGCWQWDETFSGFCSDTEKLFLRFDIVKSYDDMVLETLATGQDDSLLPVQEGTRIGTTSVPITMIRNEWKSIALPLSSDDATLPETLGLTSPSSPEPQTSASKLAFPSALANLKTPHQKKPNLRKMKKTFTKSLKKLAKKEGSGTSKEGRSPSFDSGFPSLGSTPHTSPRLSSYSSSIDLKSTAEVEEDDVHDSLQEEMTSMKSYDFGSSSIYEEMSLKEYVNSDCISAKSFPSDVDGKPNSNSNLGTLTISGTLHVNCLQKELHPSTPRIALSFILSSEIEDRSGIPRRPPFRGDVSPPLQSLLEKIRISSKLSPHHWVKIELQEMLMLLQPPQTPAERTFQNICSARNPASGAGCRPKIYFGSPPASSINEAEQKQRISRTEMWFKKVGRVVDFSFILKLLQDLKSSSSSESEEADARIMKDWLEVCLKVLEGFHSAFPVLGSDVASLQLASFTKLMGFLVPAVDEIQRKERPHMVQGGGLRGLNKSEPRAAGLINSSCHSAVKKKGNVPLVNGARFEDETDRRGKMKCNPADSGDCCLPNNSVERLKETLSSLLLTWWNGALSSHYSLVSSFSGDVTACVTHGSPGNGARRAGKSGASGAIEDWATAQRLEAMKAVTENVWRYLFEVAEAVSPVFERNLGISLFAISKKVLTENLYIWLEENLKKLYLKEGISTECFASKELSSKSKPHETRAAQARNNGSKDSCQILLLTESKMSCVYFAVKEIHRLIAKKSARNSPLNRSKLLHSVDTCSSRLALQFKKWLYPVAVLTIEKCVEVAENFLVRDEEKDELTLDNLVVLSSSADLAGHCYNRALKRIVRDDNRSVPVDTATANNCEPMHFHENRNDRPTDRRKIIVSTSVECLKEAAQILKDFWVKLDWDDLHFSARQAVQDTEEDSGPPQDVTDNSDYVEAGPASRDARDLTVIFIAEVCKLCSRFSSRQRHKLQKFMNCESWKDVTNVEKVCVGLNNIAQASAIVEELPTTLNLRDSTTLAVTREAGKSIHQIGHSILQQILKQYRETIHCCVTKSSSEKNLALFFASVFQRDYMVMKEVLSPEFWPCYCVGLRSQINRAIAKQEIMDSKNASRMKALEKFRREVFNLIRKTNAEGLVSGFGCPASVGDEPMHNE